MVNLAESMPGVQRNSLQLESVRLVGGRCPALACTQSIHAVYYAQGFYRELRNVRHKDGAHGLGQCTAEISHTFFIVIRLGLPCGNRRNKL